MLEGLPPNNAAYRMRLRCDEMTARRIADLIVETFDPAETAAAAFEETTSTADWNSGPWIVEVYFGPAPDEAVVRDLVASAAGDAPVGCLVFDRVEQRDWVSASLDGLAPVRVGRFLVHGAHDRAAVAANAIGIEIEAALAFGTGHHGSTRGCLTLMNAVARRRRPRRILDVGTGSGILAIAAARLWHRRVSAGDIDRVSIDAARGNSIRNRAGRYVRPVAARGIDHPALRNGAPYDLVLANILARPLRGLAPALRGIVAPGGEVILSGLIARDVPSVVAGYVAQGFAVTTRLSVEGWASLSLRARLTRS